MENDAINRRRFSEEQIAGFAKQAAAGILIKEICRKIGFRDTTIHERRAKYGGMEVPDARWLREFQGENAKLAKLLAELGHNDRAIADMETYLAQAENAPDATTASFRLDGLRSRNT